MTATYTWDVFSTLDGYGSYNLSPEGVDWGGYWSKQGPELLEWRAGLFADPQRMVYGATTFREVAGIFAAGVDPNTLDEWNARLYKMPATVVSSTLDDTLGWPDATIENGDAAQIIRQLKETSDVPLRSQASLSLNWSLLAAGLVDRIEVSVFPVISGKTGISPIYAGLGDYDLELLDSRTLDGRTLALTYQPTRRM
ncbi:dihydrofolate reductase family protein [Arthrobacter tecti]